VWRRTQGQAFLECILQGLEKFWLKGDRYPRSNALFSRKHSAISRQPSAINSYLERLLPKGVAADRILRLSVADLPNRVCSIQAIAESEIALANHN
jgi:hypothetical protein